MSLPPTPLVLFALGTGGGLALAALAWRQRPTPGATPLVAVCLCTAVWLVGYALELSAESLGAALFWANVQWLVAPVVPVLWFVFALEYAGHDEYVVPWVVGAMLVPPALTIAVAWTGYGSLMRESVAFVRTAPFGGLVQTRGPAFWLAVGYGYSLVLGGAVVLARRLLATRGLYGGHLAALTLAAVAPVFGNALSLPLLAGGPPIDVTPFLFLVSQSACLIAVTGFDLFETRPVPRDLARDAVVEHMADGVVVVDESDRVVDANRSARTLLGGGDRLVGRTAGDVLPAYDRVSDDEDVLVTIGGGYVDLRETALTDSRGRTAGHAVVLRDVTERQLHLQGLTVLNRVLRHNLRNEMNVVHGYATLAGEAIDADAPDGEVRGYVDVIGDRALHVVDLAGKAREMTDIFDRRGEESSSVRVGPVVDRAVAAVRADYPEVDVAVDVAAGGADAWCDPVLEVVVDNLVENAAEHNTAADPRVEVAVDVDADRVTVAVRDNGPGIPPAERVVVDGDETPLRHGSGIGLWLVSWGVRTVGGDLSIADRDPTGSVVTAWLPRADGE